MKRVGLGTGVQAAGVMGLYVGFSITIVSALTRPDELLRHLQIFCFFPITFAIILGPLLARRRVPNVTFVNPIEEARALLESYNEGQGKWRAISHIKSDGRTLRIDLNNLSNIRGVVKTALTLSSQHPIRFIVGRGSKGSRNPKLRAHVLEYIEKEIPSTRMKRSTSSIEVYPPTMEQQQQKSNQVERFVLYSLPIVLLLAWLELR